MSRSVLIPSVVFVFLCLGPSSVEARAEVQSVVEAVVTRHGAALLSASNVELTGQVTGLDGLTVDFTLHLEGHSGRFLSRRGGEALDIVENDRRSLARSGEAEPHSRPIPLFSKAFNLVPAEALVRLFTDPRFAATLVESEEGLLGIFMEEGLASGERPSAWHRPLAILTFWLDENHRIIGLDYADDRKAHAPVSFRYIYSRSVDGDFLQPSTVERSIDGRFDSRFESGRLRTNVYLPTDYFSLAN